MAYREVRMMDIDQVMRRWLAGERIRAVARSTGLDRNTVRRLIRVGQQVGLKLGAAWPDEAKLQSIRERLGRPGAGREQGPIEQALLQRQSQIQAWLKDRLILTKIHELLGREGLAVPYPTLHRFARKHCGFGKPAGTVRRIEATPAEFAEVDFGQLGLLQELSSSHRRVVHGFMMVMGYSRLSCVIPVFFQDLVTVIDCFEQAFEFFGGCPRRVVIDGMKACLDKADPCTPRFNRTFLEYANYRGFLPDAARPRHPKDKDQASYCTPLDIFDASLENWRRSRNRLPGCAWGNGPVGGSNRISPLSSARTARRTPSAANRFAVAKWTPICAAISGAVSHPWLRRCCA